MRFALLFLLLQACTLFAAETPESLFQTGNAYYEKGDYQKAADTYGQMIRQQAASTAVYFNLGNTYFKLNELGRAIYYYRKATAISPRDVDIRANLALARTKTGEEIPGGLILGKALLQTLSWNEASLLFSAANWCFFLLLALSQARPAWKASLRLPRRLSAAILLLCLGLVAWKAYSEQSPEAVVVVAQADVRYGPLEESKLFFTARDGSELKVTDFTDHWVQVVDNKGRTGWLKKENVLVLN